MQWIEVSVPTRSDEIDDVCAQLAELGAGGMVVEDEADFQDFLEHNHQYWDYVDDALEAQFRGVSRIKFYLSDDDDGRAQLETIRAGLGRELTTATVRDSDWENNWRQYYQPIEVGEKLVVVPEWLDAPADGRIALRLDPGLIFGTGSHPTTRMCLAALEQYAGAGKTVLDLGCGTGALALLVWRPDLKITGLELQDGPLDLFRQSITANELENVTALQGDLRQMRTLLPHGSMDYVICNPPYFDRNAGANAPTAEKRTARQDATCSVEELAVAASFVLHTGGKAAFLFRPERLWVLLEALSRVRLVPKRMRFVHQSVQAAPSVVMIECRKGGSAEGLVVEPPLIVESDEYFRIYGIEH